MKDFYARCKALIFPGEEDFGIVPVEAMASGKPVVAFAKGGALETVLEGPDLRTGVLFSEQEVGSMAEGLRRVRRETFDPERMRAFALGFDTEVYKEKMTCFILEKWRDFRRESS